MITVLNRVGLIEISVFWMKFDEGKEFSYMAYCVQHLDVFHEWKEVIKAKEEWTEGKKWL